jgi:4-amino-4-deoxy-L-arabinose transferase-like glycosyltransferase
MTRRISVSLLINVWVEKISDIQAFLFSGYSYYTYKPGERVSMPISLDQTQNSQGGTRLLDKPAYTFDKKRLLLLFWLAVALLLVAAVIMRLYHLNAPFDRDSYDEGVYWQSLRAMLAGLPLYHTIFYSQPPAFLLVTFPGFALFGGSLWAARFSIALVSLLGFAGAYVMGKSLAGRLGVLAALLLLLMNPFYLQESQIIQAEASSEAFTLLAIGFALLWWRQPDGRRGICWAVLSGVTLALSIFCKLLCVSTVVPIAMLMLARVWQIWNRLPGTGRRSWLPILAGVGAALVVSLLLVLPFLGSFQVFWSSVITFHQVAGKVSPSSVSHSFMVKSTLITLSGLLACYGTLAALLRRDWRVLPLLAWLLVTFILLWLQKPLFFHHLIALEPPLIALVVLGVAEPASYKRALSKVNLEALAPFVTVLAFFLVLIAAAVNFQQDLHAYQFTDTTSASASVQKDLQVANDLRQAIAPNQWVITDGQFVAGLADRSTPPSLVDTSGVRIATGYVTLAQLEQAAADPRVHAVLFYTGRFSQSSVAAFHSWVARHFHLLHSYGKGQELWVR